MAVLSTVRQKLHQQPKSKRFRGAPWPSSVGRFD